MESGKDFIFHRKAFLSCLIVNCCVQLSCSHSNFFFFNFEVVNCCLCVLLSWKKLKV